MAERPEPPRGGREGRGEPNPMLFLGAGFEFAAATAGLGLLGLWIDTKLGTRWWFTLIGFAVGLVGGVYRLWKTGKRFFE